MIAPSKSALLQLFVLGNFVFSSGKALVYGNTLEAFSMVQTLLAAGLPGSRVVLVQPPVSLPTCFNNPFIEDAVTAALQECGKSLYTYHCAW